MSRNATGNEPVLPHKAGNKPGKLGRNIWYKPGLSLAGFVLFWAAAHEPPAFTAASTGVWIIGTMTAALLAKAALVLAGPVSRILMMLSRQWFKNARSRQAGS
ncbi:MAG TPA: hypothetical protein PK231_01655 [Acidocella sp.]|nr:hypothetical protein [Acidocella sp.]